MTSSTRLAPGRCSPRPSPAPAIRRPAHAYYLHNNAGAQALRDGDIPAARAHLDSGGTGYAGRSARRLHGPAGQPGLGAAPGERPRRRAIQFEASLRIGRRNGDHVGIAYASLGLACLAADAGDWHRAAALHGVAQAFLDRAGEPWEELEARYRQDSLDQSAGAPRR